MAENPGCIVTPLAFIKGSGRRFGRGENLCRKLQEAGNMGRDNFGRQLRNIANRQNPDDPLFRFHGMSDSE